MGMDAVDVLVKEHDKIRGMFVGVADSGDAEGLRRRLFWRLLELLERHETMEQREWYPRLKIPPRLLGHLLHEETGAGTLLKRIKKLEPFTREWWPLFRTLRHDVLHHANEEETRLFPLVRQTTPRPILLAIAQHMRRFIHLHPL